MNGLRRLLAGRVISALLSAGHHLCPKLQENITSLSWYGVNTEEGLEAGLENATRRILREIGFDPSPVGNASVSLGIKEESAADGPKPGHLVRLTGQWSICKINDVLMLSGHPDEQAFTIGKGGHYFGGSPSDSVHLSAGGPSSILKLPAPVFLSTEEKDIAWYWRFRNLPEANGGVDFCRRVPIWLWDGDDAAFERHQLAA